ncbi:hypothetical protein BYT27DRAFT_7228998 [Phlegmacium glaucopus]|nr:hypothetical protein BYT27DRAFT_7228998 [Phlegmacium glaucopus]
MDLAFNPKDGNTFLSACLDRTVKMWSLGSSTPNFSMEAHDKGVNYVDFYPCVDKPYLVTTGDDKIVKVWDYLSKSCVQTMEGHTNNVSFAMGQSRFGIAGTYHIKNTLSYALERSWCVALRKDANEVPVGFDEGVVVIKVHGTRLPLTTKEIGSTGIFSTSLLHSPNGRFVTVVGDGEYIIYTSLAWRNKSFGNGISFAWAPDSNTYAVLESKVKLKVYKNFRERPGTGMKGSGSWSMESLHGGTLLGARGAGFVMFCDWESGDIVRRIDVEAQNVSWFCTPNAKLEEGAEVTDEGVEEAFEVVADVSEGGLTINTPAPLYLLGYIPSHNRVYLIDKDLQYQTAILRGDTEAAEILPTLPTDQLEKSKYRPTTDPDDLDTARQITHTIPENESEIKWKALGDRDLTKVGDLSALMLLLVAVGDRDGLEGWLGKLARIISHLLSRYNLGDSAGCVDLLTTIQRAPEAALFARTYAPRYIYPYSQAPKTVQAWKLELTSKSRTKIPAIIADPCVNVMSFMRLKTQLNVMNVMNGESGTFRRSGNGPSEGINEGNRP